MYSTEQTTTANDLHFDYSTKHDEKHVKQYAHCIMHVSNCCSLNFETQNLTTISTKYIKTYLSKKYLHKTIHINHKCH